MTSPGGPGPQNADPGDVASPGSFQSGSGTARGVPGRGPGGFPGDPPSSLRRFAQIISPRWVSLSVTTNAPSVPDEAETRTEQGGHASLPGCPSSLMGVRQGDGLWLCPSGVLALARRPRLLSVPCLPFVSC